MQWVIEATREKYGLDHSGATTTVFPGEDHRWIPESEMDNEEIQHNDTEDDGKDFG